MELGGNLICCSADDPNRDVDVNVRVQVHADLELAEFLDRAFRHANLATLHVDLDLFKGLGDIERADRPEKLAFGPGVGLDHEFHALDRGRTNLGRLEFFRCRLLELGTPRFDLLDVLRRRQRCLALRQQVIAAITRFDLHEIADLAEILDVV
jgi:hypothetical protein